MPPDCHFYITGDCGGTTPPPPSCTGDSDCTGGARCRNGVCTTACTIACNSNSDCGTDEWCDVPGSCGSYCVSDFTHSVCEGSSCRTYSGPGSQDCNSEADCVPTQTCVNDGICHSGETCSLCPVDCGACIVNGACQNPPNGNIYVTAPTGTLCSSGIASPSTLSGSGPWSWQCTSPNGGTTASCSASVPNQPTAHITATPDFLPSPGGPTQLYATFTNANNCYVTSSPTVDAGFWTTLGPYTYNPYINISDVTQTTVFTETCTYNSPAYPYYILGPVTSSVTVSVGTIIGTLTPCETDMCAMTYYGDGTNPANATYLYYPSHDQMISSYCIPVYDNCSSPAYNINGTNYWIREGGKDTSTCLNLRASPPACAPATASLTVNTAYGSASNSGSVYTHGYNDTPTLTWSSTNANSCTLTSNNSDSKAGTNGTNVPANSLGNDSGSGHVWTYTLSCTGNGGSGSASVNVIIPPAPTNVIMITPSGCGTNGTTLGFHWTLPLGYSTSYVRVHDDTAGTYLALSDSTYASTNWSGTSVPGHTYSDWFHTSVPSGAYSMAASGPAVTCNNPGPSVTLAANPNPVNYNSPATLSWTISNATACTDVNGNMPAGNWSSGQSGSASTGNLTASQTDVLTCTGPGGSDTNGVVVNVLPPAPTLSAATSGACGGKISVSWNNAAGATSYNLYRDGSSINSNATSTYIDSGLVFGSSHNYKVVAVNSAGNSPDSNTASATASAACAVNSPPVAVATISKDGSTYANSITVAQGVSTHVYLAASKGAGSSDPDGWADANFGVSSGGKCDWNSDLNQGAPTYETTVNSPASAAACDIDLGNKTFNDTVGTYTYSVLRITDKPGAVSNIATVQVTVVAGPPGGGGGGSLTATAGVAICPKTGINLYWQAGSGATTYNVYRNTVNNSHTPADVPSGTAQKIVSGVPQATVGSPYNDVITTGGPYYYWVESVGGDGTRVPADQNTGSPAGVMPNTSCATAPNPPTGGGTCNSDTGTICPGGVGNPPACLNYVRLTWTDNSDNETGFKIYMDGIYQVTAPASSPASLTGEELYYDFTTPDNNIHSYSIAATNAVGDSAHVPETNTIASYACGANLIGSDKETIAVNGALVDSANMVSKMCNDVGNPLPSYVSLKSGDILTFSVDICNKAGTSDMKNISVVDTLANLQIPGSDWKMCYSTTPDVPCAGNTLNPSLAGSPPNQTLTVNLTGVTIPAGQNGYLVFNAMIQPASSTGSASRLFQNRAVISSNAGIKSVFTPLQQFLNGNNAPIIQERP